MKSLIAGPGVYICEQCVNKVHRVVATGEVAATPLCAVKALGLEAATAKCSFCGKRRHQVDGLATTGHDSICSECVALCREIIREELD